MSFSWSTTPKLCPSMIDTFGKQEKPLFSASKKPTLSF